jgi:hypothetical protein
VRAENSVKSSQKPEKPLKKIGKNRTARNTPVPAVAESSRVQLLIDYPPYLGSARNHRVFELFCGKSETFPPDDSRGRGRVQKMMAASFQRTFCLKNNNSRWQAGMSFASASPFKGVFKNSLYPGSFRNSGEFKSRKLIAESGKFRSLIGP